MTTVRVNMPPGTRTTRFWSDGVPRVWSGPVHERRTFADPQRLARFVRLCKLFGLPCAVTGQLPLPLGGAP